ncbi:MAG: hypothetical protein LBP78_04085 [Acidaminococcales bacterium]|jgi:hypothetical protein|nr:hypothetical protein [Acidaminococcales bacterium]
MPLINVYKEFNPGKLTQKIKSLNRQLSGNNGRDRKLMLRLLDEIYSLVFFCLEKSDKAILLESAETLKLAYGTAGGEEKLRPDEDLYWRDLLRAVVDKDEYQAVEYFLESGKTLLKILPGRREAIIETIKTTVGASMSGDKFFIGARAFAILIYCLPKFTGKDSPAARAAVDCCRAIGAASINAGEEAFFREICVVLAKKMPAEVGGEEACWDRLFSSWLGLVLAKKSADNLENWQKVFTVYCRARPHSNTGFFAGLIGTAARFAGKVKDELLKKLLDCLVRRIALNCARDEYIPAARALCAAYKAAFVELGWERGIFVYQCLFLTAFYITGRLTAKNACTDTLGVLAIIVEEIVRTAGIATWNLSRQDDLLLLLGWREYFCRKSRSTASRKRIATLWLLLAGNWKQIHTVRAAACGDLLEKFNYWP